MPKHPPRNKSKRNPLPPTDPRLRHQERVQRKGKRPERIRDER